MKCSFTVQEYRRTLFRNTAMEEPNKWVKSLFIVCMNMAGVLVSLMGITTYLYRPYLIKNAVFGIPLLSIQQFQYPLQSLIDIKYFTLLI